MLMEIEPRTVVECVGYQAHGDQVASVCGSIIWTMSPQTALELRKTHLLSARQHRADYRATGRYLPRHMWRASLKYSAELGRAIRRTHAHV